MAKKLISIIGRIKRFGFYIPFTIYFAIFASAIAIAWYSIADNQTDNESSFKDIFTLLIKVAGYFTFCIVIVALFSVVFSFLHFISVKRKKEIVFQLSTDIKESKLHQKQTVRLLIAPILKPLFGFIKIRLQYDDKHFSNKFSLVENGRLQFFRKKIEGIYYWSLPEIKEYRIEKAVLYFEDVFQFFSVAVNIPTNNQFFTQPILKQINDLKTHIRKTDDNTIRIDEMRRVNGEYLNYKNFEDNDDVRRIVWKIYAKNKELVVRIPEIMDPYASHIYMYTSFFSSFQILGNSAVEIPFLNYFKTITWSIYQNLIKQGFDVKYISDQEVAKNNVTDEQQKVKYSISVSKWQSNTDLKSYIKTSNASVIVISSLSNASEVEELIHQYGNAITFIFIKLTDSFKKQNLIDWVQWLFVENDKDDIDVHKRNWAISALRFRIKENEEKLEKIIGKKVEKGQLTVNN